MKLATIGYEGAMPDAVFAELESAKIGVLVDVRAVTSSRRPGFSKNQLAAELDEHGIGYVHLRGLGTPREGRQAVHSGHPEEMRRIYAQHMKTPEAKHDYEALLELARGRKKLCLLCYEHDPEFCHRTILAERVHEKLGTTIEHLTPSQIRP